MQSNSLSLDLQKSSIFFEHVIDGRILFPATGYLLLAWQQLANILRQSWDQLSVIFEEVVFLRKTVLQKSDKCVDFVFNYHPLNGRFELFNDNHVVCEGVVREAKEEQTFLLLQQKFKRKTRESLIGGEKWPMDRQAIYEELQRRGYHHQKRFQVLHVADIARGLAILRTSDHVLTTSEEQFLVTCDALLQSHVLSVDTRQLLLPTRFEAIHCDPKELFRSGDEETETERLVWFGDDQILTSGLEIYGFRLTEARKKSN